MELVVCKQLMQPQCQKWWFVIHRWYIIIIWNVTLLNCPASVDVVILSVLGFLWSYFHMHTQKRNTQAVPPFPVICSVFFFVLHLWLCLCKAICCLKKNLGQIYLTFLSLCRTQFPPSDYNVYIITFELVHVVLEFQTVICFDFISNGAANLLFL